MRYTVTIVVSLACVAVQALPISDDRGTQDAGVNNLFSKANNLFGTIGNDLSKLVGSLADQLGAKSKRGLLDDVLKTNPNDAGLLTGLSSAADVIVVLDSVGIEADDERLNRLLEGLEGGNIDEFINDASDTLMARSPNEEAEDCSDPSDAEDETGEPNTSCDAVKLGAVDVGVIADMVPRSSQDVSKSGQNSPVESSGDTVNDADDIVSNGSDNSSLIDDSSLTANDIENGVSAEGGDKTDLSKRTIGLSADGIITGIGNTVVTTGVTVDGGVGRDGVIAVA